MAMTDMSDRWNMRRLAVFGLLTVIALVFGLGGWGYFANISGAVIGAGALEVEGNRQVIQHPTGGTVIAINARDGDNVEAGTVLVELEGVKPRSELEAVNGQWLELLARIDRLNAEKNLAETIEFNPELTSRVDDPVIAALMEAQRQQFETTRDLRVTQEAQIHKQIAGLTGSLDATKVVIDSLTTELDGKESLKLQGLTPVSIVLTLQRSLAQQQGAEGQVAAEIAELTIEISRLYSQDRDEAIAELRDVEYTEIEVREKRNSLMEEVAQLELRAPVAGTVYGRTVDTRRAVISAGQELMFIVPKDAELIVRANIDPGHIDSVHVDQEATLRFSAFDARTTPELTGHVSYVSPDAYTNEATGQSFYRVDIRVDAGELERLGNPIKPGMPVEAFIKTGDRSALSYFLKPLSDYFTRAFRDG